MFIRKLNSSSSYNAKEDWKNNPCQCHTHGKAIDRVQKT
jgi:hypothetical protein